MEKSYSDTLVKQGFVADASEELADGYYLGYLSAGVADTTGATEAERIANTEALPKWHIVKIIEVDGVTKRLYAGGNDSYKKKWSDRAALSYTYKK